jgi:hypothetical protein
MQIAAGLALAESMGFGFTVTFTLAEVLHPLPSVPVTV